MRVRVGCEFQFDTEWPVPMLMLVRARPDGEHRTLEESRSAEPDLALREYQDAFGNPCWRFVLPAGHATIRYDAVVGVSPEPDPVVPDARLVPVDELPDDTLVFTLPSRYIESDLLIQDAWQLFAETPTTWARVQAVCDWIHANVEYRTGSSGPATTALDVYRQRAGVCRDFALLGVAFCRALNIPARYTFGYLPDIGVEPPDIPMDFHAWFEAYLGGRWYTFDARHNEPRIGRVKIGHGRDAVDVALTTAYGAATLASMVVGADEIPEPGRPAGAADAPAVDSDILPRGADPNETPMRPGPLSPEDGPADHEGEMTGAGAAPAEARA